MPRVTPRTELERLVALLSEHPDGLGIDAIARRLDNAPLRRTLQRRLALLILISNEPQPPTESTAAGAGCTAAPPPASAGAACAGRIAG